MRNLIINLASTGGWQDVVCPDKTQAVSLQMRENQVDMLYRYRGTVTYWTVKAGTARLLVGEFWQGDIQVQAAVGNNFEIETTTRWAAGR